MCCSCDSSAIFKFKSLTTSTDHSHFGLAMLSGAQGRQDLYTEVRPSVSKLKKIRNKAGLVYLFLIVSDGVNKM